MALADCSFSVAGHVCFAQMPLHTAAQHAEIGLTKAMYQMPKQSDQTELCANSSRQKTLKIAN